MDHDILFSKLQAHGIQGPINKWFYSYFKNCTQTHLVNCSKLLKRLLQCRVPQGTILGPFLFLLYANDVPNCLLRLQPRMYADDTSIMFTSIDVEEINQ